MLRSLRLRSPAEAAGSHPSIKGEVFGGAPRTPAGCVIAADGSVFRYRVLLGAGFFAFAAGDLALDLGFLSPPPCARAIQFGLVAADSVPRPAERFVRVLERLLASPQGIAARGACLLELPLALIRDPLSFVCDPLSLIGDPLSLIGDTVSRVGATPSLVKLAP